jgi:hypothetical protein
MRRPMQKSQMNSEQRITPPASLQEAISPEWLTSALSIRHSGIEVISVDIIDRLTTVADKVRVAVTCSQDGKPVEEPLKLCLKAYFGEAAMRRGDLGRAEAAFYRDFQPELSMNLPRVEFADIDESTGQALVIMEDLVATGATFAQPLGVVTPDAVEMTLGEYARLHATHWGRTDWSDRPWLVPKAESISTLIDVETLAGLLSGPRSDPLPAEMQRADTLVRAVGRIPTLRAKGGTCLLHGDAHVANSFHRADGRVGLVDWQLVQFGCWALDVAYHIGSALSMEDRTSHERELLDSYLGRLRSLGVETPAEPIAWDLYQKSLIYGYYLWAITRFVAPPIINAMVERLGLAVAHHDSISRLLTDS